MRCRICQNEFVPSKFRANQGVCSQPECQRIRQIQNQRAWQLKNPDYFKYLEQEGGWRKARQRYSQLWKITHKNQLKEYEDSHKKQHREYMREYMREYRKKASVNRNKS